MFSNVTFCLLKFRLLFTCQAVCARLLAVFLSFQVSTSARICRFTTNRIQYSHDKLFAALKSAYEYTYYTCLKSPKYAIVTKGIKFRISQTHSN